MKFKNEYEFTGLKVLIGIIIAITCFYFSFHWANEIIHWIVSGIKNHDLYIILTIVLWVISFSTVFGVTLFITGFALTLYTFLISKN